MRFREVLFRELTEPSLTVDRHVHQGHEGDEGLVGADIRGRFFAPDVLLASRERQAERAVAVGVLGLSNQAAGNLAEQNLSKAHYLAGKLPLRFSGPYFNEFVAQTNGRSADEINQGLLKEKIIGGLALKRFYPELDGAMLLCATEMSRREHMDTVGAAFTKEQSR